MKKGFKRSKKEKPVTRDVVKTLIKNAQEVKYISFLAASNDLLGQIDVLPGGLNYDNGYHLQEVTPYISQGTTLSQRIGDTILIDKIRLSYQIFDQGTNATGPTDVRVILFQLKGCATDSMAGVSGIDPSLDVKNYFLREQAMLPNTYINYSGVAADTVWDANSQIRPEGKNLAFKILYDQKHRIRGDTVSSQVQERSFVKNLTFKRPIKFAYRAGAASLGSLISAQFLIVFLTDSGNSSNVNYTGTVAGLVNTSPTTAKRINCDVRYFYRDA